MRKVVLTISKLGLVIGNVVTLKLVDSVGKPFVSPMGYSYNQSITLSTATLEVDLLENSFIPIMSHYKLTLPNAQSFSFKVPSSYDATEPHDLLSLFTIGCTYGIIDQDTGMLDADFTAKLDLYFMGANPHFSASQKDVVALYEYYANEVITTANTIDVIEMMDTYLSTLIGVPNA